MRRICLVLVLILFWASFACAFFKTGNDLVSWMQEYEKAISGNTYDSYDAGSYTAFLFATNTGLEHNGEICKPKGLKAKQLFAVVKNYLNDHPEKWTEPGYDLARNALMDAFPCEDQISWKKKAEYWEKKAAKLKAELASRASKSDIKRTIMDLFNCRRKLKTCREEKKKLF